MSRMRNLGRLCGVLVGLITLGLLAGCNGEGIDSNSDTPSSSTQQVTVSSTDAVNRVLELMLGNSADLTAETTTDPASNGTPLTTPRATQGLLRVKQPHLLAQLGNIEMPLPCGTGSVTLRGNVDTTQAKTADTSDVPFTVSATARFNLCDGMDGTLTLASQGSLGTHHMAYLMSLSGTLQAELCSITFDQLTVNIEANASGLLIAPIIGHGSIQASCSEATLTCTLNNMDLDDYEMFEASCIDTERAN